MTHWTFHMGLILGIAASVTQAQEALPKELSGRYVVVGTTVTQVFSLQGMTQDTDNTFKAKLTWWTRDQKCVIRNEPIIGRITATGIAFDARTKCDVPFTVELNRAEKKWIGKAATTDGPPIVLELQAN